MSSRISASSALSAGNGQACSPATPATALQREADDERDTRARSASRASSRALSDARAGRAIADCVAAGG